MGVDICKNLVKFWEGFCMVLGFEIRLRLRVVRFLRFRFTKR